MSDEIRRPVREIFANALELKDHREREGYLAQACGQDSQLRQQVESLLSAHQEAGAFLQPTVVVQPKELIGEGPGTVVGRYTLRSAMPSSMPTRRGSSTATSNPRTCW